MEKKEFIETVMKLELHESVILEDCGVRLEFKHVSKDVSLMVMRTHSGDILISVPYADIEEFYANTLILTYNRCVRAYIDVSKISRVWGI